MQNKVYDLEERTRLFAFSIRAFVKKLVLSIANKEDIKQVVRSSGSIGANYIEANENLGTKDFLMRIKICRKEAKETIYWLSLLDVMNDEMLEVERVKLKGEATELMKIFGAILTKSIAKIA
ncbi:MAG: four helix bundle protein [Sphingobacteriales bacterium]|nr:MAG: four helix bundle protein [Sphingobacteriales bacterium]